MAELPTDWQERFVAQIAGRAPLDGTLFSGGPTLSPLAQVGIYRDQYRLRLTEAIRDDLRGLGSLLGRDALDPLIEAFLLAHPSRSWSLSAASRPFADWYATREPAVHLLEMARIDLAVQHGFTAASGQALTLADLVGVPDLALAPHATLLWNTTNVHQLRSALLGGRDAPALERQEVPLVLYRQDLAMRHLELEPGAWQILQEIAEGASLIDAIEAAVRSGAIAPEAVESSVGPWFQLFAGRGLVVRG